MDGRFTAIVGWRDINYEDIPRILDVIGRRDSDLEDHLRQLEEANMQDPEQVRLDYLVDYFRNKLVDDKFKDDKFIFTTYMTQTGGLCFGWKIRFEKQGYNEGCCYEFCVNRLNNLIYGLMDPCHSVGWTKFYHVLPSIIIIPDLS